MKYWTRRDSLFEVFDADLGAAVEGAVAAACAQLLILSMRAVHVAVTDVARAQTHARLRQRARELVRATGGGALHPTVPLVRAVRTHRVTVAPVDTVTP